MVTLSAPERAIGGAKVDEIVQRLVDHYGMQRLPVEGTWFVSTYRAAEELPSGAPIGTAMIGLYSSDPPSISMFHRLQFDEVWHFYGGDPMRLILLRPDGTSDDVVLGPDPLAGQHVQYVIPAGVWQAGEIDSGGRWALFGCTMAPGFTGTCFEGGHVTDLTQTHPDRAADIRHFGIPDDHTTAMPDGFAT